MSGMGIGWLAPTLLRFENSIFTSDERVFVVVLYYLAKTISPFFAVFAVDRFGRKWILECGAFIFFGMWIAVYASKIAYVHCAIRLIFGVGAGMVDTAVSIYIGENCSPKLRGIYSGLSYAFFYFGEVVEILMAVYLSYEWLAICNGAIGCVVVILSRYLLRETAHFLIAKDRTGEAEMNYDYLHVLKRARTRFNFEHIKLYVREQRSCIFSYRSKEISKGLRIVLLTNFLSAACGFSVVNLFVAETVSLKYGWKVVILFAACQCVSAFLASVFMDKFYRRTLFLVSGAVIAVVQAATATLLYLNAIDASFFILLATSLCLIGMFTLPLTTAIQAELLSQNVKAVGPGTAVALGTISAFLCEIILYNLLGWGALRGNVQEW
jgi:MFS family permease